MRIAFGTDTSTAVTAALVAYLRSGGHEVEVLADPGEWPEVGRAVAERVAAGGCERGVVCCWTGTGVAIAANKVPGARAALCGDAETARGARLYNDANVVALSVRLVSEAVGAEILDAFLATGVDPSERDHVAQLETPGGPGSGEPIRPAVQR